MTKANSSQSRPWLAAPALFVASACLSLAALASTTDLANAPLASGVSSTAIVKPNIAFVFDDSGSMDDDNMPDEGVTNYTSRCFGSYRYNTLFYNPNFTYKPPYKIDGTAYSDGVPRFPDASFTAALKDGYFASGGRTFAGANGSNTTTDLSTLSNLTTGSVTCDTASGGAGSGASATITVGGSGSSTSVTAVNVNGTNILSGATNASNSTSTVATRIATSINNNSGSNYTASAAGNVVTIKANYSVGALTTTPTVSKSGGLTLSAGAFSGYVAATAAECGSSPSRYYYSIHKLNSASATCDSNANYSIVTDASRIAAPGIPDSGRTAAQVAAAKTNYANWYSYYRRRAYLLKASAGEAFHSIDENKYRVGLFFLNSVESGAAGTTSHANNDLKIADFSGSASGTQRYNWFARLYGARADGYTPTRGALARMGRMFAGKISGWDPVQYSCQQNFSIVSTDGYWNTNSETSTYAPKQIDGTTDIGDADAGPLDARPATAQITISNQTGGGGSNGCYRFTSVQVTTGDGTLQLLNSSPAPATCTTSRDTLGAAVSDAINAKTGVTQFKAGYSNGVVTITSPVSLGGITTTPAFSVEKVSGSKRMDTAATAFSGFAAATTGAPLPFKDVLGARNTLGDIAWYYWSTDLRTAALGNCSNTIGSTTYNNLCENNVFGSGDDKNGQQHMTTFTLGLGVSGRIRYNANYKTEADDQNVLQYVDIANGAANWPVPNDDITKIDDLWHAAVNGRGVYYSTSNPQTLQDGIQAALAGVQARTGSSAAAATSNLEPVAGDNFVYVALYRTVNWDGDLKSFTLNPDTGSIASAADWSAQAMLDAQVSNAASGDGRTIKFFAPGATTKLKDFTLTNLTAEGKETHFADLCSKTPAVDQCGTDSDDLSATKRGTANDGDNLVNYLRGASALEMRTSNDPANQIYRAREHILGDVVNAVPVYMKKPPFDYDTYDPTYGSFRTSNTARAATVYVAANDGMLHAMNAVNGTERWAYVPSMVMPRLYRLADRNYSANHQYFVDGSPTVADVCGSLSSANAQLCNSATDWKTILVGGLNKGGCGYYALDVTDPTSPRGLWEFTNANLGYSYGNPVVAKRRDGRWVVFLTSGYNNYSGNGCGTTGDGNGHVFVVDALSGALLEDIVTYTAPGVAAGSPSNPSGLAKLNAWIPDATLPIASRLYGGDLQGNLWRIDFDDNFAPAGKEALLLATLKDGTGSTNRQPITTKPELAEVSAGGAEHALILVGTGKYLGSSDLSDHSTQSVYAIKDKLTATGIADVRGTTMIPRTLTDTVGSSTGALAGRTIRTVAGAAINWALSSNEGWYLDFNPGNTSPGERVNVDLSLQLGTLTVATNVPAENACNVGGTAYLYFLDYATGKALPAATDGMAGVRLSANALVAGVKTVKLTSGKTVTIVTDTAGNVSSEENPGGSGAGGAVAKRTAWREIAD